MEWTNDIPTFHPTAQQPPVPSTMRAVVMEGFGGPDVLTVRDVPTPHPDPGEVLVRVRAAFVAFGRDVGTRSGAHPFFHTLVTPPHILGGEFAGTIAAVGNGVDEELIGLSVAVDSPTRCGDCEECREGKPWDCRAVSVIGLHRQGSHAQFCTAPAINVEPLPDGLSFVDAALLAANGPLAYQELQVGLTAPGDWVLVPGASGSVGTLTVALAARIGARVIALTRQPELAHVLTDIGAEVVLDTNAPDLAQQLRDHTGRGVDVVIDNIALTDLWQRYWPAVARRGRIVFAGRAAGERSPLPVDIVDFYNRRALMTGLSIGDPRPVGELWREMRVSPLTFPESLVHTFSMADARRAHSWVEQGAKAGHCVLTVD